MAPSSTKSVPVSLSAVGYCAAIVTPARMLRRRGIALSLGVADHGEGCRRNGERHDCGHGGPSGPPRPHEGLVRVARRRSRDADGWSSGSCSYLFICPATTRSFQRVGRNPSRTRRRKRRLPGLDLRIVQPVEELADVVGLTGDTDALEGPLTGPVGVDRPHLHSVSRCQGPSR